MQVFFQIVAFSSQSDGSGRPVLTKGQCPNSNKLTFKGPQTDFSRVAKEVKCYFR